MIELRVNKLKDELRNEFAYKLLLVHKNKLENKFLSWNEVYKKVNYHIKVPIISYKSIF